MTVCRKCGGQAAIRVEYAKMNLCEKCFLEFYEKKVRETVLRYRMFEKDDRVAVAVSGGKDSASLLFALRKCFPEVRFSALHINVGIPAYSEECEARVRELVERIGVELILYDIRKKLGISIPDFSKTIFRDRICSPCGTVKRYLLNKVAWEKGFTKVATGHNLDDLAETIFSAYLQGDIAQLVRLKPVAPSTHPKLVAKVKPLWNVTEKENLIYAELNQLPVRKEPCPLSPGARSKERKAVLDFVESRIRGFKHTFMSSHLKRILPVLEKSVPQPHLLECSSCGMPSTQDPCAFCRRVGLLRQA
jgi:uncharacterized protein (TIGR00269 family)